MQFLCEEHQKFGGNLRKSLHSITCYHMYHMLLEFWHGLSQAKLFSSKEGLRYGGFMRK